MVNIIVAGCDGYIGYPLVQHLLKRGHKVYGIDYFYRRKNVSELGLESIIPIKDWDERLHALDNIDKGIIRFGSTDIATDHESLLALFEVFRPEGIINLAQQPSAAYSMISPEHAAWTISNNVNGLLNIFWAMREYTPKAHLVTLGTLGEYGFPNMNIPEGFFKIEFDGMHDILPFPKQPGSVYHTSKVMASDLGWFAARIWELRCTDIMQGVVYGTRTPSMTDPVYQTRYDVGECFGTMINRAVACAIMEHPIIPYGTGLQTRGYIALRDSIKCLTLAIENPPSDDDSIHGYRVINQFDECYTCNDLADLIVDVALNFDLKAEVKHIPNPRIEAEVHYYNPQHEKLYKMGWRPTRTLGDELVTMFEDLIPHKEIMLKYKDKIVPHIKWRPDHTSIKE